MRVLFLFILILIPTFPVAEEAEFEISLVCTMIQEVELGEQATIRVISLGEEDYQGFWLEDGEVSKVLTEQYVSHMDIQDIIRDRPDNALDSMVITQPGYHSGTQHLRMPDGGVAASMTSQYLDEEYQLTINVFRGTCKPEEVAE